MVVLNKNNEMCHDLMKGTLHRKIKFEFVYHVLEDISPVILMQK